LKRVARVFSFPVTGGLPGQALLARAIDTDVAFGRGTGARAGPEAVGSQRGISLPVLEHAFPRGRPRTCYSVLFPFQLAEGKGRVRGVGRGPFASTEAPAGASKAFPLAPPSVAEQSAPPFRLAKRVPDRPLLCFC